MKYKSVQVNLKQIIPQDVSQGPIATVYRFVTADAPIEIKSNLLTDNEHPMWWKEILTNLTNTAKQKQYGKWATRIIQVSLPTQSSYSQVYTES